MKTIIKEINLLDKEDIEEAISEYLGRPVSIAEIECTLAYCIPAEQDPSGAYLEFTVEDEDVDSYDLFYSKEYAEEGHYWKGKRLSIDEPWLPVEEIFNFSIEDFKSFNSWVDSSD